MSVSVIIALLVFPVIATYYLLFRKNPYEKLSFDIRRGLKCYVCGEDFDDDRAFFRLNDDPRLCKSCKRDYQINDVQNVSNFHTRLLYFLYSSFSVKIQKKILFSVVGLLVIGVTISITTGSDWGLIITNSLNISYWLYMIFKELITRKALSKL